MAELDKLSFKRQYAHGGFRTNRLPPHGIEVWLYPDNTLDGHNYLFIELARTFNKARVLYKIEEEGSIYFLAPFGMKFGWLLGEVARVYWLLQREVPPMQQQLPEEAQR